MSYFLSLLRFLVIYLLSFYHSSSLSPSSYFNCFRNSRNLSLNSSYSSYLSDCVPSTKYRNNLNSSCILNLKQNPSIYKKFINDLKYGICLGKYEGSGRLGTFFNPNLTHQKLPLKAFVNYSNFIVNFVTYKGKKLYSLPKYSIHEEVLSDLRNAEGSDFDSGDSESADSSQEVLGHELTTDPERYKSEDRNKSINARAAKIWEKYSHLFKPLETYEEKVARISNLPFKNINVNGVNIEVRMGSLGLPWYIDEENRRKLEDTFDPEVLAKIKSDEYNKKTHFSIIKEEEEIPCVPLPGAMASYLPDVKVLDHKVNIPDYDYVTLLHDSSRNYTWTYQQSKEERAKSFEGEGELDTYEVVNKKIIPSKKKEGEGYKKYVPKDYVNAQENPYDFFPRKTLDTGVFRQPRMQDVLNRKLNKINKEDENHGYNRDYQNFWETTHYRDNGDKPGMRYKEIGKRGLKVSEVGLGTMMFGSTVAEAEANEIMDYAYDKFGVNFIDTCELYPVPFSFRTSGNSERILGKWIKRRGSKVREDLVISTRILSRNENLKFIRNNKETSMNKKNIIKAVEDSLERMGLDHIDLVQFAWPDRYVPKQENGDYEEVLFDVESMKKHEPVAMEEQIEAVRELIQKGKVKEWGFSNETPWGVLAFYQLSKEAKVQPPVTVQLNYNLLCRNDVEKGFVELARRQNTGKRRCPKVEGIGIVAYGPLAGGILTGKYLEYVESTTSGRLLRFPSFMKRYRGSLAAKAVGEYYDVAMEFKMPNLTSMALKWVYSRPFILSTIIGANDLYQLRENLYCLDPELGMTDLMERKINQIHWKWRDPIRIIQ